MLRRPRRPEVARGAVVGAALAAARAAALAAALAACASGSSRAPGGGAPAGGPVQNAAAGSVNVLRIEGAGSAVELASVGDATGGSEQAVAVDADRAYATLVGVYESLGLAVNFVQSDARVLGVRDARLSRHLGKHPLSRYLNCGNDAMAGPAANSYTVTLTAVTRVSPAGPSASTLLTQVAASARSASASGGTVRCGTTGRLEKELNAAAVLAAVR
jgi:hypothetical protein